MSSEPAWRRPIVRAIAYSVYFLLFFELAARLLFSIGPIFNRVSTLNDSSFRIGWIKRHRTRQDVADFSFNTYHPTRGWALKPAVKDLRVFDGKVLNTNSKGLRGRTEYEYRRQPGKRRIVILGDSFTFGTDVSDEETYASILGSLLPNTEVLNLSVHAYGHDQMLLYLKEEGVKYQPDVVLLGFVWLDIYRSLWTFDSFAKPKFELHCGGLRLTHVPVPTPDSVLAREPYRLKTLDLLLTLREKLRWSLGVNEKRARELTKAILSEMVATARAIGAVPVIVYLPVADEVESLDQPPTEREQYLNSFCQEQRTPCLFLRPRLQEAIKEGLTYDPRSHWNAEVHRIAAKGIRNFLVENGQVSMEPLPERKAVPRNQAARK